MTTHTKAQLLAGVKAGADLSSSQYIAVKFDGSGDIIAAGAGELAIGILQNAPADEASADVAIPGGGALAACGGTVAAGAFLKADANGKLVATTTDNDFYVARAITAGVANDVIHVVPVQGFYGA